MSSCRCAGKALYCIQYAKIPTTIFQKVECPCVRKTASSQYVTCYLASDVVVSGSVDLDKWPITWHGTTVEVVLSVLEHGLLMKAGDLLHHGTAIKARHARDDQPSAIWTYPTQAGAEKAAAYAEFDMGETKFKALIRVRQMPGTYTEHPRQGFGYDVWSTERRGTHYIEAIDVLVVKAKGTVAFSPMVVSPISYITSFSCPVQKQAFAILELLKLPHSLFNGKYNRCYCTSCYPTTWKSKMQVAGETYAIPRGWTRFGLAVNPVLAEINDIWNSWQIAFHGCHPGNVLSIAKNRTLLIPHDILPDGKKLQVWSSVDKNQKCYFLSPAIGYSAHPWYAKPVPFTDLNGKQQYFQTVFVFKVRPGTYKKKEETENGEMKMYDDYSIINEDEVEWYSSRRGCTHPYGLLVRKLDASNLSQLNIFFELDEDSPFRQTFEHKLKI